MPNRLAFKEEKKKENPAKKKKHVFTRLKSATKTNRMPINKNSKKKKGGIKKKKEKCDGRLYRAFY